MGCGRATILLALNLILIPIAGAKTIPNPSAGYIAWVPDNWKADRSADVAIMTQAVTGGRQVNYTNIDAFEPTAHVMPFQYPYALVQKEYYPHNDSISSISEK